MEVATFGGEQTLWRPGARCESLIEKIDDNKLHDIIISRHVMAGRTEVLRGVQENSGFVSSWRLQHVPGVLMLKVALRHPPPLGIQCVRQLRQRARIAVRPAVQQPRYLTLWPLDLHF